MDEAAGLFGFREYFDLVGGVKGSHGCLNCKTISLSLPVLPPCACRTIQSYTFVYNELTANEGDINQLFM